jgi:hypothetical protein
MDVYRPNSNDANVIPFDMHEDQNLLGELVALAENADRKLVRRIIEGARKFVGKVIAPMNRDGNQQDSSAGSVVSKSAS